MSNTSILKSSWLASGVFVVVLAGYLGLVGAHGRLFNIDEVFYKAAGAHWAMDGHFAAPELIGRLPFDPPIEKIFACYPPLYPFAFGVFARVFGFGHAQVCLFDALLRVALCAVTACTVRRLAPGIVSMWPAVAAGLLVLPLGAIGRPDDLAVVFGLLACMRLLAPGAGVQSLAAGVLLGLSAATSLVAAGVFAAIATGLVLGAAGVERRIRIRAVAQMAGVSMAVLVAAFVPLLLADGHAWRQLLDHGADNLRTGGFLETWKVAWRNGRYVMVAGAGVFAASMLLLVAAVRTDNGGLWARWFPAALAMIVLIVLKTGGKYYYVWFTGPWLVAASVVMLTTLWADGRRRGMASSVAAVLAGGCVYGAQFWVVERLVVANLPPEQRFDAAAVRIKTVVPAGATVMAFEHWVTLAGRNPIRDHNTPSPADTWGPIDYIVLTGNGSRQPGVPQLHLPAFVDYAAAHFEKIDDNLAREPLRIGGVRITNSAYGWGAAIYKRVGK